MYAALLVGFGTLVSRYTLAKEGEREKGMIVSPCEWRHRSGAYFEQHVEDATDCAAGGLLLVDKIL